VTCLEGIQTKREINMYKFFKCEHPSIYCTECFRFYNFDFTKCNSIHKIFFRMFYVLYKKLHPNFIAKSEI
jgi:hypothetical protein